MAQNNLPIPFGKLMVLAGKCKGGLVTYGAPLNITQLTPATLQTDIDALAAAVGAFNAIERDGTNDEDGHEREGV